LIDINGDGLLDNLFVNLNNGTVSSATHQLGGNNLSQQVGDPSLNAVKLITDGFDAETTISYLPLTNVEVYSRMRDSKNADWGGSSVVYDLVAPSYVVNQVQSSAPIRFNPSATSSVEYHYVGAKIQGGGRGFLGFSEIVSYDPQSEIRTNTRYRQDHPYIGLPAETVRALTDANHKFDLLSNRFETVPRNWEQEDVDESTNWPGLGASGTILSHAINKWTEIETVSGKGTLFPYIVRSLERSFTLSGLASRKVYTENTYNNVYGDLDQVIVSTYAGDSSTPDAVKTSVNDHLAPVTTRWFLGRLTSSTVTHARTGVLPIQRHSTFTYHISTTGLLKQETIELGSAFEIVTDYEFDDFGNRRLIRVNGADTSERRTTLDYDPLGRFVIKTYNHFNQLTQEVTTWDAYGNALTVNNADDVVTTSAADHMGRPFISYNQTGSWSKTIHRTGSGSYCPTSRTAFYTITTGGGQARQYHCFDKLGRDVRTATQGFASTDMVYLDRYFDDSGRGAFVSEPDFSAPPSHWNETEYDPIGRIIDVTAADDNNLTYVYDELVTSGCTGFSVGPRNIKTTNEKQQSQIESRNALGETTFVFDADCGKVSYEYDAVGNLSRVEGAGGAETLTVYDVAGRKISIDDPDKGFWEYDYNALGELIRQLDNKAQAIDFQYDNLGRVYERWERAGVDTLDDTNFTTVNRETTTWHNSNLSSDIGKGQSINVVYRAGNSGSIINQRNINPNPDPDFSGFDQFGRVIEISTTINGVQLVERTSYDEFGRVFQQFDSSGDNNGVRYHYTSRGYVEKLQEARYGANGKVYQEVKALNQRGNIVEMLLADGSIEATASYEPSSGRIEFLAAGVPNSNTSFQFVEYEFDVLGNLKFRNDMSAGGSNFLTEDFEYDDLNRLETVMLTTATQAQTQTLSIQYNNAAGNITYKSDVGSYAYGQNGAGPHAVSSAGGVGYFYDDNGNQTSGGDRTIIYTVFDKAEQITNVVNQVSYQANFDYGIGNSRIQREDLLNGVIQKTTQYFGSVERIVEGSTTSFKRYIGGVVVGTYYPTSQAQNDSYLLKDHLGSIHTVLNDSAEIVAIMHFSAFGERQDIVDWQTILNGFMFAPLNDITTRGFTGHEQVDEVGVVHMNGRIYDPKLGRMLQADPFVQSPKNSQSLNRYSYVLNNPLSYTDPSGFFSVKSFWKKIRPFVSIALVAVAPWGTGFWATVGTGALSGYVVTGNLKGAVIGAFSAAAFYGIGSSFEGLAGSGAWGESGLSGAAFAGKTVLHGAVGGVVSLNSGGKFGHGFAAAGFTQGLSGQIGKLNTSQGRVIAAAIVGGSSSAISGGKFANGAVTGAFSRAFNAELHPFIKKTLMEVRQAKFWRQFQRLSVSELKLLFPSFVEGASDDYEIQWRQHAVVDGNYRSGLADRVLEIAHDGNDLLRDYSIGRVTGIVGSRGRIAGIIGEAAGLTRAEKGFIGDAFALKAFANQQGVNITQLHDLATTLQQSNSTIAGELAKLESFNQ
jgi:RHS repeat-associated protein